MRFVKSLVIAAALAATVFATPSLAQMEVGKNRSYFSPDQQFGIGVNNAGLTVQYAMGPAFHIGMNLNLDFMTDQSTSETAYNFGPYAKFLFNGGVIHPYIYGAVGVIQPNTGRFDVVKDNGEGQSEIVTDLPKTQIRTYIGAGAEHFFNQNVGVYGHVNLLDAKLSPDPSTVQVGLRGGVVGIEFFF